MTLYKRYKEDKKEIKQLLTRIKFLRDRIKWYENDIRNRKVYK